MSSTETIPISTPEVEEIIQELIENGGELTPDMEIRLQQIGQTVDGAMETLDRIVDLENFEFVSKMWVRARQIAYRERRVIAKTLRHRLVNIFAKHPDSKGSMKSPVRRKDDGAYISYVSKSSKPGPVDIGPDAALATTETVAGYTLEQIEASEIPMSFFAPHTVFKPNMEMIGEYLDQGVKIGLCRRIATEAFVRVSHPKSLQAAADKIRREDHKKAAAERNKFSGANKTKEAEPNDETVRTEDGTNGAIDG